MNLVPESTQSEQRWNALRLRQPEADGQFCYAVRTTGVYCRPSCRSRLPRRENVRFFEDSRAAERAGFRPCKRCHPDGLAPARRLAERVARACRSIQQAVETPPLATLAAEAGLSRFHFQRLFKRATGLTPKAWAVAWRAQRLRERLSGSGPVTEAIYEAGFNSSAGFYSQSQALLGMRPRSFQGGGHGVTIRVATARCSLGWLLVAATDAGVCALALGERPRTLLADLERRFPRAQLRRGGRAFRGTVQAAVRLIENPASGVELPLDLRGSAFQLRVWQALRAVPAGQTVSYGELARRLGLHGSARAVGRAVATNPIAVAVPCHRVIRSDGALSGYRWGVDRKRTLLVREGGRP